ncbi:PucR family transcriptional regulator [Actinomadura sp. 6N118]|uniref:PucR family transcriptional regulator n=1 Tax=Actinomadura sp. 6N118 TaxID=3375151 RepID=UPI0037A15740
MTNAAVHAMTRSPWQALLPALAEALRPDLPQLADEIVEEIRRCVPEFARPLQGVFAAGFRLTVEQGLRQFVDRIGDPYAWPGHDVKVLLDLGRGEFREGRSIDSLQAAYRVGARVSWRCFAIRGLRAGFPPETMCALTEAIFVYSDEVAALSVQGYAELRAKTTGTFQRRRQRLLELVIADPPVSRNRVSQQAAEAQWRLPGEVACVALEGPWQDLHLVSPAVSSDVLMDIERPDPYLLVPDADGPGRQEMLARALRDSIYAVGPVVPLGEAALSLRLARQTLALCQRGIVAGPGARSVDHLPSLMMLADEGVAKIMTRRSVEWMAKLNSGQRERFVETLLAFLDTGRSAPEIAQLLNVHAQTVRYRMGKLKEILGENLNDPEWRLEMQLALHVRRLLKSGRPAEGQQAGRGIREPASVAGKGARRQSRSSPRT